ncbi:unnamed protein product [Effrenium voratum]|uniref:Uncharacterized protein n=1 Tax=Effrenium voratum TaxID=2562239 RepID=A0AA36HV48_9DINO|nr:unnamed protein product [Effrenium voratum]CAJ1451630.1 unnamed protein product [Effrenium voratum]
MPQPLQPQPPQQQQQQQPQSQPQPPQPQPQQKQQPLQPQPQPLQPQPLQPLQPLQPQPQQQRQPGACVVRPSMIACNGAAANVAAAFPASATAARSESAPPSAASRPGSLAGSATFPVAVLQAALPATPTAVPVAVAAPATPASAVPVAATLPTPPTFTPHASHASGTAAAHMPEFVDPFQEQREPGRFRSPCARSLPAQIFSQANGRASRPLSRPKSPKHEELYVDAAARRERHQGRLAASMHMRQQWEAEQQNRWEFQRMTWQASYKGPQDPRSHAERELELLRKRQSWQQSFHTQQALREQQELRECTFRPDTSRSGSSFRATRQGSSSQMTFPEDSRRASSRSSSRGHSPRDSVVDLVALYEKQVQVLRRLSEICADPGGDCGPHTTRPEELVAVAAEGPERLRRELRLYRRQLEQVHVLERLDMTALELPAERLQALIALGFKLGLAEELRGKLPQPGPVDVPDGEPRSLSTQDELLSASSPG